MAYLFHCVIKKLIQSVFKAYEVLKESVRGVFVTSGGPAVIGFSKESLRPVTLRPHAFARGCLFQNLYESWYSQAWELMAINTSVLDIDH